MLAITKKVAVAWQIPFTSCPVHMNGHWVVDFSVDPVGGGFCLVTHQDTLFTIVFYHQRPTVEQVLTGIAVHAPWFQHFHVGTMVRNGNRRVTGSMNDMKFIASALVQNGGPPEELQDLINNTRFSLLGMARPCDAVAQLHGG